MSGMTLRATLIAAAMVVGATARAHELVCDKTANGATTLLLQTFPASVTYQFVVSNVHPLFSSTLLTAEDAFLHTLIGFDFTPAPPVSIPVDQSLIDSAVLEIESFEQCLEFAHQDGVEDNFIDNVFVITFEGGSAECAARVTCVPPTPPTDGGVPDGGVVSGATRTMGFYKVHESALSQCLAVGDVDFGAYLFIDNSDPTQALIDALGLLWGSPNMFADGTTRDALEKARFLDARQLLTALCNFRLFGTSPTTFTFADAIATLNSTDCAAMATDQELKDAFNSSGDAVPFPPGFMPGPATPQHAQSIAVDPTSPQPGSCSP